MSRPIKFKVWDKLLGKMIPWNPFICFDDENYEFLQFTGLQDKNGSDVYEGDIIKLQVWGNSTVEFCSGGFVLCRGDEILDDINNIEDNKISKIVGNIFENPEILK